MAKFNPFEYLQEVRGEADRVTWPTRRETLVTTGLVFALAIVASIFFLIVDQILQRGITLLLGLGR